MTPTNPDKDQRLRMPPIASRLNGGGAQQVAPQPMNRAVAGDLDVPKGRLCRAGPPLGFADPVMPQGFPAREDSE